MYRVRLVKPVAARKREIEEQLALGDRRNEQEYKLLLKGIEKLKTDYRFGVHISKKRHKKAFEYLEVKCKQGLEDGIYCGNRRSGSHFFHFGPNGP